MIFEDIFNNKIRLENERWNHIVFKHPEMSDYLNEIENILKNPDLIKKSILEDNIILYYKFYPNIYKGIYIVIVVAKNPGDNFIITVYISDQIKRGELIWIKD